MNFKKKSSIMGGDHPPSIVSFRRAPPLARGPDVSLLELAIKIPI